MSSLLDNIVKRQNLERGKILQDSTVKRTVTDKFNASLKKSLIKAVIGPRRSGKSSFVHQMLSSLNTPYAYLNFEDEQLPLDASFDEITAALDRHYPEATTYFFDEIQVYPRWEQAMNRLERGSQKTVIISGSNSKMLSSELSSTLTGRYELFEILPFSLEEFLLAKNVTSLTPAIFNEYITSGGFPAVVLGRVTSHEYLRELWDAIVLKDIVQRYNVRNVADLKALLALLRSSLSSPTSFRSLERALMKRVSIATIAKFCGYAENAYLVSLLQNFSFKTRERINADKKVYLFDNAFYTSTRVGGQADYGKLLENLVFLSLRRKGYLPNLDYFYYKTRSGKEIDFITLENGKPSILYQICWELSGDATREREFEALEEAAQELSVQKAIIITAGENAHFSAKNVEVAIQSFDTFSETQ
jgi:predicted AAA+ superfamily ATPase